MLLEHSTYVDDMGESKTNLEDCINLTVAADRVFNEVGLKCKMWTVSGSNPSEIVSQDGLRVLVAGQEWFPKMDFVAVKIPPLHFGKVRRGKVDKDTKFFVSSGDPKFDFDALKKFCPPLTRKCVPLKLLQFSILEDYLLLCWLVPKL